MTGISSWEHAAVVPTTLAESGSRGCRSEDSGQVRCNSTSLSQGCATPTSTRSAGAACLGRKAREA